MNKFKEQFDALKEKISAQITSDSTPEEIEKWNSTIADLDSLATSHDEVVTENAKFKDTIVRMVTTQGDSKPPIDGADGGKPKTIEECIAEELSKKEK